MNTRKRNKLGNDPLGWLDEEPDTAEATNEAPAASERDIEDDSTQAETEPPGPPQDSDAPRRGTSTDRTAPNKPSEDTTMATSTTADRHADHNAAFMQSAVEGSRTGLMMCDTDMNIVYANPAVVKLLGARRDVLRREFPGFDPDNLVGQSIDQFHKDPAHQRAILQNPSRLPYEARISVAGLRFNLNATAILDADGQYMGNMVEWQDVTEQEATERERARMRAAVEGADSALMMCDEDMNIVYANPAVVKVLRARRSTLRDQFPGFDPDNLVGQSIDQFHKDPSHQRAILQNPERLPYNAKYPGGGSAFQSQCDRHHRWRRPLRRQHGRMEGHHRGTSRRDRHQGADPGRCRR